MVRIAILCFYPFFQGEAFRRLGVSFRRFGRAFRHFDGSIRRSDDSFRHFAGPFVVGDSFRRFNVASVALTILSVTSVEPSVVRDSFRRFGRHFRGSTVILTFLSIVSVVLSVTLAFLSMILEGLSIILTFLSTISEVLSIIKSYMMYYILQSFEKVAACINCKLR